MPEPNWQKNLRDSILLDPLILFHGNVKDIFPVRSGDERRLPATLRNQPCLSFDIWLALEFERQGIPIVLLYDPVDGAVALRAAMVEPFCKLASSRATAENRADDRRADKANENSGAPLMKPALPKGSTPAKDAQSNDWLVRLEVKQKPADFFRTLYENVLPRADAAVAVVCRFTDRYLGYTDRQGESDKELSLLIQKAAMAIPQQLDAGRINSRIALIFNIEGEVPQELNVQAPFACSILVPSPTVDERDQFFRDHCALFDASEPGDRFDQTNAQHLSMAVNLTDGLKTQDLFSLIPLSRREKLGLGPRQVKELLDRFRFGTRENAWQKITLETLRDAKKTLAQSVKGQDEVIDEVVPVLIRAKLGMSDISSGGQSSKPRGVFFFVGPTGVGKTELSKAIATLIFGDDSRMIRFDMSEYSEEHQQARLIGAPPGYVGFDQGGQLTNAILERPFSVVLFDEIEKAHGRILDKFLQVLDDGRLTDGMGRTVYFSEAILIFTSNIGTAPPRTDGSRLGGAMALGVGPRNVEEEYAELAKVPYRALCEHFRKEVKNYFVNNLGRPEILNRIGEDNILVFNFLTDDMAKNQIIDQQIKTLEQYLRKEHMVGLYCTNGFKRLLRVHPHGFERNGARGVRNLLKRLVLNPLASQLLEDAGRFQNRTFRADYQVGQDEITSDRPMDSSALNYDWISE